MTARRTLAIALTTSIAFAGLVTATATSAAPGAAPAAKLQPRAAVTNTSVMAVIKTISLLNVNNDQITGIAVNSADDSIYVATGSPGTSKYLMVVNGDTAATRTLNFPDLLTDVAVNQVDDTVYVSVSTSNRIYAIRGATDDSSSISLAATPAELAVHSIDDTVYVTRSDNVLSILPGTIASSRTVNLAGSTPLGVAVNDVDDTIYVANNSSNNVSFINGVTDDSQQFAAGTSPAGVAVNQADDTVYVTRSDDSLLVMNGATGAIGLSPRIPFMTTASDVAVHQGDDTVYVTVPSGSTSLYVLRGTNVDDSTASTIGSVTGPLAVDDTGDGNGLVYVAASGQLKVVGFVSPVLSGSGPGAAGATVTVSVTSAPTVAYNFDSAMVKQLRFNGTSSVNASPGPAQGQWSATLPSGLPAGQVTVEAVFEGGAALAGNYTVQSSGPPAPVYPPGAPTDVVATAGVEEASVSWKAPSYSGSYPITDYQVTSAPGAKSCLVKAPALSCTVTGLTAGVEYTFQARALNGAGWGVYSESSNAVTPSAPVRPSIVITGSRDASDAGRIQVAGTSTGLVGERVTPFVRFPGGEVSAGTGVQTVAADGSFAWSRKTGKKTFVYFAYGSTRSNTVVIPAR